ADQPENEHEERRGDDRELDGRRAVFVAPPAAKAARPTCEPLVGCFDAIGTHETHVARKLIALIMKSSRLKAHLTKRLFFSKWLRKRESPKLRLWRRATCDRRGPRHRSRHEGR